MPDNLDSRDLYKEYMELSYAHRDGELHQSEQAHLTELENLIEELNNNSDEAPEHGIQLIHEDNWVDFTTQMIDELYPDIEPKTDWPYRHITLDYEAAAEELQWDYMEITYEGNSYLYR